jgi:hypothetical protein
LHPSTQGISAYSIPLHGGLDSLDIHFDVHKRAVVLFCSDGRETLIDLATSPSVAEFYVSFMAALADFGLKPTFLKTPLDMTVKEPFDQITAYHHYDWASIREFWQAMRWTRDVFQEFSGRFYGKTCPVHIYWHSLDLTVTRFSGKRLPNDGTKSGRLLERDSYSHEQISCGFWAGDHKVPQPMFYAYTFPSPEGLDQEPLQPSSANWIDSNGSPMAVLSYAAVRESDDPRKALLEFLESSYQAGAKRAGWKIEELTAPPLSEI